MRSGDSVWPKKIFPAKDKLSAYVSSNSGARLDQSNAEYYQLRTDHLHAVAAVNGLRAKKTHDENLGVDIFGVRVPYANLVRDGLMICIKRWIV